MGQKRAKISFRAQKGGAYFFSWPKRRQFFSHRSTGRESGGGCGRGYLGGGCGWGYSSHLTGQVKTIVCTLPTDQLFNLEFQFESVFNLEVQPKFGIQLRIPISMGINLGECGRWAPMERNPEGRGYIYRLGGAGDFPRLQTQSCNGKGMGGGTPPARGVRGISPACFYT